MASTQITDRVLALVKIETQPKGHAYPDHQGYLRIGLNRCIDYRISGALSPFEIDLLARNDLHKVQDDYKTLFGYVLTLCEPRVAALIELAFFDSNGAAGVIRNVALMNAIKQRDYITAGDTILHSPLGAREPLKAARLAAMMASGEWPQ